MAMPLPRLFPQEVPRAAGEKAEIGRERAWLRSEQSRPSASTGERGSERWDKAGTSQRQKQLGLQRWSG